MMRILVAHNIYQQRGGEDIVVDNEVALLKSHGHQVELYLRHNNEITGQSKPAILQQTIWSQKTSADMLVLLNQFKPDVIHVHNTLPLISPSLYWAAARLNIPVVQTLHNFRLLCPQATFLRQGKICDSCVGHLPWRAVIHRCYRDSAIQSAVLAGMLTLHHALGSYQKKVTRYIALNEFCKNKYIQGGIAPEMIDVKANFVTDCGSGNDRRDGFLFVGRLSPEKGVGVLAGAFDARRHGSLTVVGEGSESACLQNMDQLKMTGALPSEQVKKYMQSSLALVLPSICYENMPMTLVEAFCCGLPVIASRIGALATLVEEGKTGLLFNAGDETDLAEKMAWAAEHPVEMAQMGLNARAVYLMSYTPEANYQLLIDIYNKAIGICLK